MAGDMGFLLDSLFDNSSVGDAGGPSEDAGKFGDFEELCRLQALKFPELMLNSSGLQHFVRSCVQALNSSAGNETATAPPASAASEAAIIAIYCVLAAGCLLGNAVVICVILFNKSMRQSVTNIMVINLAVADFCVGIFSCVQAYLDSGLDTQEKAFSSAPGLCKFQQVLQVSVLTGTVCILLVICVDRYLAIVYPLSQRQHRRKRWYLVMGCAGWLFAAMFGLPNLYFYDYSGAGRACRVAASMAEYFLAYYICSVVLLFALPLLVMTALYGRVSARLLSSIGQFGVEYSARNERGDAELTTVVTNEATTEASGDRPPPAEKPTKAKASQKAAKHSASNPANARKRTVQMFITIVAAFFVCKLPKTIYVLLLLTSPGVVSFSSHLDVVVAGIYLLYLMPSACNPAVYFLFSRQFRAGLLSLLACRR